MVEKGEDPMSTPPPPPPPPSLVTITTIAISPIPSSSPPSSLPRSVFTGVATTTVMLHRDYFDAVQVLEPDMSLLVTELNSYEAVSSKDYVTFYLTNGPEYHISQITDAVMVAKHLGATLVLPDIRGSKPGDERTLKISSSLELQPGVSDLVESMIQRLKKSGGRFEAIDLRVENLRYLRRRIAVRQVQWWDPRLVTTHKRSRCS
ncbi:hypothetical protein Bca4012_026344 [Brassica carinata]